jgi:outer membrane biosynthesis protein TonB
LNPTNTDLTQDGLSSNFVSFLGAGNDDFLKQDQQVKLTLDKVPYPIEACVPRLGGTAILGVITDRAGAISKGPEILQSSGYGIFNQAAIAAATTYTNFTPTKVYIITVPFAYSPETCPGVSAAPPTEQVTQNPNPTPSLSSTPANPSAP